MDEDFKILNKKALLEEFGTSLNNLNEFVNAAIEQSETDGKVPFSALIGMSHQIGFITAVYNQYMIFEIGLPGKEQETIGFKALAE